MPFIFQTKSQSIETKSKEELFEIFMVEIGQYKRLDTWWFEISWDYIKQSDLSNKFKDWLSKKS